MNTEIIGKFSQATLEGKISFPEAVAGFLEAGVESYQVDYVNLRQTFYGEGGGSFAVPIPYENLPVVAGDFGREELRAAIRDSQRNGQIYRDFTKRAMEAGVQGYIAFLRGKRVTYWGRTGDQHTEWFPGAQPANEADQ